MRPLLQSAVRSLAREERAAQIVEFAVALPLLVLFVVGIFDFSAAYTLKQKLTNAARDASRVAAADPASDLGNPLPVSVSDAFQVVDNYLVANHINDCGINVSSIAPKPPSTWTFSATGNGCGGSGLVITVNRGYYYPSGGGGNPADVNCIAQAPSAGVTAVISTCVSIQYAYPWRFGRVASLLGARSTMPANISAVAVAMNEN